MSIPARPTPRVLRETLGLTIVQVAVRAGVSPQTAAKFELAAHGVRAPQRRRLAAVYEQLAHQREDAA